MGIFTSILVVAAGVTLSPSAATAAGGSFIFASSRGACSVSGPGLSAADPYCSLQSALDAAQPGDTVVANGAFGPLTVSHSGTTAAPITIEGFIYYNTGSYVIGTDAEGTATTPGITFTGVHDVNVLAVEAIGAATSAISIVHSHDLTLDSVSIGLVGPDSQHSATEIAIDGQSSNVTLSRVHGAIGPGSGVGIAAGASHVIVTTSEFNSTAADAISVVGASDIDITSNSLISRCGSAVSYTSGASGVVENNVAEASVPTCTASVSALTVSADSAAAVTTDYNAISAPATTTAYTWAGTTYATAAAFAAATGQGHHDIVQSALFPLSQPVEGSPLIDSADANAPGELATDFQHKARADDLEVVNGGSGFHDRGPIERQDVVTWSYPTGAAGLAPFTAPVPIPSAWTPLTTTIDFGDGSTPLKDVTGVTSHVYATPGTYVGAISATGTDGVKGGYGFTTVVETASAPQSTVVATRTITDDSFGVLAGSISFTMPPIADQFEVQNQTLDFGDGTSVQGVLLSSFPHQYAAAGTYTATLTDTDFLGRTTSTTTAVTAALGFQPVPAVRDYDSRTALSQQIPAGGVVKLSASQLNADTLNYAGEAVVIGVTASGEAKSGFLTVYPDGTTRPNVSTVNFAAGQTIANQTTTLLGSNGSVDFYNGSAGPIDLIVDTYGTHAVAVPANTYVPVSPVRVLDTRVGLGAAAAPVAGGHTIGVGMGAAVPLNANSVIVNVTTTNAKSAGYLKAYESGVAVTPASASNWAAGGTVSNLVVVPLGADGKINLFNGGTGSADFITDVVGFYANGGTQALYLPSSPARVLDTRNGTGTGVTAKIGAGQTITLHLTGANGVAAVGTKAVSLNLTALNGGGSGWLTLYPDGATRPVASSLNYVAGNAIANATIMPVGADGSVQIYNGGTTAVDVIADLTGSYYSN